jgi:hypothetical protein
MLARGTFRPVFVPKKTAAPIAVPQVIFAQLIAVGIAYTLTADVGAFVLNGQPADLYKNHHLAGQPGAFVLDGQAAEQVVARVMAADVGEITVDGQSAELNKSSPQGLVSRGIFKPVFVPSRNPARTVFPQFLRAQFKVGPTAYVLPSNLGPFELEGQSAALFVRRLSVIARGIFRPVFVPKRGQATIRAPQIIRAPSTGQGVAYTIAADVGAFALDGQPAAFVVARYMSSDLGAFAVDGQPATFNVGLRMAADVGGFVLDGQDATFRRGWVLASDVGAFVLAGQDAALVVGRLIGVRLRGRDLSGPLLASRDTSESYW